MSRHAQGIAQILAGLPHRHPILLVDRVESPVPGETIHAVKAVSMNESFFREHFPGRPIMLIIYLLGQLDVLTYFLADGRVYLTTIPQNGRGTACHSGRTHDSAGAFNVQAHARSSRSQRRIARPNGVQDQRI